nr:hypothetical protein [Tanacetum cinerariifolium]
MAQQVISSAQLVLRFHTIGRCNNYTVLQSIPCSSECKIVGKILLDHPDDIPFVSVYTTGNVLVRGMLILDAFLTEETRVTNIFKEYEMMFMNVDVPINQPQLVISTQGTYRSTPRAHRHLPLLLVLKGRRGSKLLENHAHQRDQTKKPSKRRNKVQLQFHLLVMIERERRIQEKLDEKEIEKMVKGDDDKESYASEFAYSVLIDDVDDFGNKIEPGSHKDNLENIDDDDDEEIKKEKKDEEQKQTLVPSLTRD